MQTKIAIVILIFFPFWIKGGLILLSDGNRYSYSSKGLTLEVAGPIKTMNLPGFFYKIRMTNISNYSVVVDSSLVASDSMDDPDLLYDKRLLWGLGLAGVLSLGTGLTYIICNSQARSNMNLLLAGLTGFNAGIGGGAILFSFYSLKEYHDLEKNIFRGSYTIIPGQTIERDFWLKRSYNAIRFNYEAIRVIEP